MNTIKKHSGWINLLIIITAVLLGVGAGSLADHFGAGLVFGIASGLTGISGFGWYLEMKMARVETVNTHEVNKPESGLKKAA